MEFESRPIFQCQMPMPKCQIFRIEFAPQRRPCLPAGREDAEKSFCDPIASCDWITKSNIPLRSQRLGGESGFEWDTCHSKSLMKSAQPLGNPFNLDRHVWMWILEFGLWTCEDQVAFMMMLQMMLAAWSPRSAALLRCL